MKRLFFSAALLAALASCSKNDVADSAITKQIGFLTLNDRVTTKAANDGGDSFRIIAYKAGASSLLYIDDYVAYGNSVTAMSPANGPYYWPTDGDDMVFYGYAPYNNDGENTVSENISGSSSIVLNYTVPAGAQEDFTVASPQYIEYVDFPADGTVDFVFRHMLSKITVKVVLADEFGKNHYISDGTGVVTSDTPSTATFTALRNSVNVKASDSAPSATLIDNVGSDLAYSGESSYYIAPQPFTGCSLQINGITIRDNATDSELFSGDLRVITFDGSELGADDALFQSGKHYVLTVTINAASADLTEISFTAANTTWGSDINTGIDQN